MSTTTEKGALSYKSTGSARLNLFFKLVRDVIDNSEFTTWLQESWEEDPLDTMKILFHGRDCRGGKGDRDPFFHAMRWVEVNHPEWFYENAKHIPFFGRWLDVIELSYTSPLLIDTIATQIREDKQHLDQGSNSISLASKWFPSERSSCDIANMHRRLCASILQLQPDQITSEHRKQVRKEYISPLRNHLRLVESMMCEQKWSDIDYEKVPSVAMKKYRSAFMKHDEKRFKDFLDLVKGGQRKIHADQVYPHELVRTYLDTNKIDPVIEAQWSALLKKTRDSGRLQATICLSDVSGSMNGIPMEVSIALGLLISGCTSPPFLDKVLTFETDSHFHDVKGDTFFEQVKKLKKAPWGGSTNVMSACKRIVELSKENKLRREDAPTRLVIISDMQFDKACMIDSNNPDERTSFDLIKDMFYEAELDMPQIVFWNVRSDTTSDFTCMANEAGVMMLSGYSPSAINMFLNEGEINPLTILFDIIHQPRYDIITSPCQK